MQKNAFLFKLTVYIPIYIVYDILIKWSKACQFGNYIQVEL